MQEQTQPKRVCNAHEDKGTSGMKGTSQVSMRTHSFSVPSSTTGMKRLSIVLWNLSLHYSPHTPPSVHCAVSADGCVGGPRHPSQSQTPPQTPQTPTRQTTSVSSVHSGRPRALHLRPPRDQPTPNQPGRKPEEGTRNARKKDTKTNGDGPGNQGKGSRKAREREETDPLRRAEPCMHARVLVLPAAAARAPSAPDIAQAASTKATHEMRNVVLMCWSVVVSM